MPFDWDIFVKGVKVGRDFLFTVTGGEAHIGAVSTVYRSEAGWVTETQELPHHKEGPLSAELAMLGAETLNATVTVVAGIHIPNATKEDIRNAVERSHVRFQACLRELVE